MSKKRIHLVCNAHLDPVWLWHWEDGLAEALSTYRIAAEFCEQNPGFVFNHNEALLYRWVEEYEPALFRRIQRLVRDGRWKIGGGAYLQPDVNNTSGESHIRHYLMGGRYLRRHFGKLPSVAYNFDSFGHAEGFPQILRGCGKTGYVFCRPDHGTYDMPLGMFVWRDRSGTTIHARRSDDHYLSNPSILKKLDKWVPHFDPEPVSMILWGIGNHGGGPSRDEYKVLQDYMASHPAYEWIESSPDQFFRDRLSLGDALPEVEGELQNSFVGCYTSMSRIKRAHRAAEGLMTATERLAALAWWWDIAPYPARDLDVAWKDILFAEFHDILPGSGVPQVERDSLQLLNHAMENLRRTRLRTLAAIVREEAPARGCDVPVFVSNPHGFPVNTQVEMEITLNHGGSACKGAEVAFRVGSRVIPSQRIQPEATCTKNWRPRFVVQIPLRPWEVIRLDEHYEINLNQPKPRIPAVNGRTLTFRTPRYSLRINPRTGLIDWLRLPKQNKSLVGKGAFQPVLFDDLDHSWVAGDPAKIKEPKPFDPVAGWDRPAKYFRLATRNEVARISPMAQDKWQKRKQTLARPVRIVEHGVVRTVVEAIFVCEQSTIVRQYVIGHLDGMLQLRDTVFYNHKDHMLKLMVPLGFDARESISEALYSAVTRAPTPIHEERTNQRWVAVCGRSGNKPVHLAVLNNGTGAHSFTGRELALNVMRSPAYASFNLDPNDLGQNQRFHPRQDQGEHQVIFSILPGGKFDETEVSHEASVFHVPPSYQVYFPQPAKTDLQRRRQLSETVTVDRRGVTVVALKRSENGKELIIRLQETDGRAGKVRIRVRPYGDPIVLDLGRYQLATVAVTRSAKKLSWRPVNLVEE